MTERSTIDDALMVEVIRKRVHADLRRTINDLKKEFCYGITRSVPVPSEWIIRVVSELGPVVLVDAMNNYVGHEESKAKADARFDSADQLLKQWETEKKAV